MDSSTIGLVVVIEVSLPVVLRPSVLWKAKHHSICGISLQPDTARPSYNDIVVEGLSQSEYISQPVLSLFPSPKTSFNLSIAQAPEFHDNDFTRWASVAEWRHCQRWPRRLHCHFSWPSILANLPSISLGHLSHQKIPYRCGERQKVLGMFATLVPDKGYPGNIPAFNVANINNDFVLFERLTLKFVGASYPTFYICL